MWFTTRVARQRESAVDRASGSTGWEPGDDASGRDASTGATPDDGKDFDIETALRRSEENYHYALALTPVALWIATPDGCVTEARAGSFAEIGVSPENLLGFDWRDGLHPEDRALMPQGFAEGFKTGKRLDFECRVKAFSGEYRWFRVQATPHCDENGEILRWYGILEDVHDRRMSEQALRESEERYRYTIALSPMIPWTSAADGSLIEIDQRALDLTGLTADQVDSGEFLGRHHPDDQPNVGIAWDKAQRDRIPLDYESRIWTKNDGYRWHRSRAAARYDAEGNLICWYGTIEDIHDRKMAEEALRWAAEHDGLTGLFNRGTFQDGLQQAIAAAEADGSHIALLLFDVDSFKQLNDRFGHDAGDALLRDLAARIQTAVSGEMMAGRLGGDEFAMFVTRRTKRQAEQAIDRIVDAFSRPFRFGNHSRECRASIGIAMFPDNATCADTLRKAADLALYEAKDAGGGIARRFESRMRARMQARQSMLSVARNALDEERITPFYQPQIHLGSRRITGFEALLRWRHDDQGMQLPASIWASFEDPELSAAIGRRMLNLVLGDIRRWLDDGVEFGRVALNVSAAELVRDDFASWLLGHLAKVAIPPTCLELEVTERVFLDRDPERLANILNQLNKAGVSIALDDFGTGYASLVHLKQFPVNVLKIDRSFVEQFSQDGGDPVVRAIIGLGKGLRIITVAEGIETELQAKRLLAEGCDRGQGFLVSPAVPADQVPRLVTEIGMHMRKGDRRSGGIRRQVDKVAALRR
jgi:diguanylate cyclase (GGDEF)-like protein/PAS domain S-box-containing protein